MKALVNGRLFDSESKINTPANFDNYIKLNWPSSVPEDCTNIKQTGQADNDGLDCLDRNAPGFDTCISCMVYEFLCGRFARLGRIR